MPRPDPQSLWPRLIDINPIALCFVSSSWHIFFWQLACPERTWMCPLVEPAQGAQWVLLWLMQCRGFSPPPHKCSSQKGNYGDCSWRGQQWKCMGNSVLKNGVNSGCKAMVIPGQKHMGPRRHLPGPPDQWEIQPNSRNKLSPYPVALVYGCIWVPTSSTCEPRRNRWGLGNTGRWFTFHPALSNTFDLPPKTFSAKGRSARLCAKLLNSKDGKWPNIITQWLRYKRTQVTWLLKLFMIFTLFSCKVVCALKCMGTAALYTPWIQLLNLGW